jgi:RNA polymerase sigma factor (TIGR02999 family)
MPFAPGQVTELRGLQDKDLQAASQASASHLQRVTSFGNALYARREARLVHQATELVHDAHLRLVGQDRIEWQGRAHLAMEATSMRRILVDRARKKMTEKHGDDKEKVQLDEALVFSPERSKDIVALDEALKTLESTSFRQNRVVELRFLGGLEMEEIARMKHVSIRMVKQDRTLARAWLHHENSKS